MMTTTATSVSTTTAMTTLMTTSANGDDANRQHPHCLNYHSPQRVDNDNHHP